MHAPSHHSNFHVFDSRSASRPHCCPLATLLEPSLCKTRKINLFPFAGIPAPHACEICRSFPVPNLRREKPNSQDREIDFAAEGEETAYASSLSAYSRQVSYLSAYYLQVHDKQNISHPSTPVYEIRLGSTGTLSCNHNLVTSWPCA